MEMLPQGAPRMSAGTLSPDGLWIWSGTEWVSALPVPVQTYRPVRIRSRVAVAALVAAGLPQIVVAASMLSRIDVVGRATSGTAVGLDEAVSSDNFVRLGGALEIGTLVLGAVVFLTWLHRVVANNHALGARGLRFSPGSAVGWWFCPFINWVRPLQILRETWTAADPAVPGSTPQQRNQLGAPLVVAWYVAFVLSDLLALVGNLSGRGIDATSDPVQTLDALHTQSAVYLVASGFSAIAAVLAIAMVTRLTSRQERLQSVVSSPTPAPAVAAVPA